MADRKMALMATIYFTFDIWMTITVMYLILTLSCAFGVARLESALRKKGA